MYNVILKICFDLNRCILAIIINFDFYKLSILIYSYNVSRYIKKMNTIIWTKHLYG